VQTLTQAQQETFEKYKDCASELSDTDELASFAIGFKLGIVSTLRTVSCPGALYQAGATIPPCQDQGFCAAYSESP